MSETILSVVIVSWNVRDLLEDCLNSIFNTNQDISFEVIIIDNNSSDGTAELVKKKFPQIKLVVNQSNFGFANACQQGVELSVGNYILFLNDDTIISDNTFDKAVIYLRENHIGVLGCKILNSDQTQQASVRRFPNFFDFIVLLTKLHNFFPFLLSNYLMKRFDYNKTSEVDQVMGAFFLTSKKLWNTLGGFDKKFYIWFEEVDYCLRANMAGYKIVYYSQVKIVHHGGASFKQLKAFSEQLIFNNSLLYYAKKHLSSWQVFVLYLLLPVNIVLTLLVGLLDKFNLNPKT